MDNRICLEIISNEKHTLAHFGVDVFAISAFSMAYRRLGNVQTQWKYTTWALHTNNYTFKLIIKMIFIVGERET